MSDNQEHNWSQVIKPKTSLLSIDFNELWRYRDLVRMFVLRDFKAFYKQTILGPLWFFIQPIMTTVVFMIIFGNLGGLSTDGKPQILFYLSSIILWNYFSESLSQTSNVFIANQGIFGKVYFPRIIMPVAIVVSNLMKLGIQLALFIFIYLFYLIFRPEANLGMDWHVLFVPFLIVLIMMFTLGMGMIISSFTTKYKDLMFLVTFGIGLLLYATPVAYPLSAVTSSMGKSALLLRTNPLVGIFEVWRYCLLGPPYEGAPFLTIDLVYSIVMTFIVLTLGTIFFNRTQQSFMDTV